MAWETMAVLMAGYESASGGGLVDLSEYTTSGRTFEPREMATPPSSVEYSNETDQVSPHAVGAKQVPSDHQSPVIARTFSSDGSTRDKNEVSQ